MKRLFTLCLVAFALSAQAQYQMANSDFEDWKASSGEPDRWHGFKSGTGTYVSMAPGKLEKSTDTRPGSTGSYSALITSGKAIGSIIGNGTMTTGQLKAGSMSAANAGNHAEMNGSSSATDKNGDRFYMALTGHPDAIHFWLKFTQATPQTTYKYASVSAVITDGTYYQDPEDKTYTNKVAQAKNTTITTCSWSEFSVPFEYLSNSVNPAAILCTFGTNATPGKGSDGDKVWVDDVELVYWHSLSALSYEGATLSFNEATTSYDLSSIEYDEAKVSYTVKGRAATATKSYNAESGVLTIRVEGEDYGTNAEMFQNAESFTEYTIQFKHKVSEKFYTEDLYVTMGDETMDKQQADVLVETYSDGTINFVLKNFVLSGLSMPVGNIVVENITVASDNTFTFSGGIELTEGDDPTYDFWLGPGITEDCGGSVPLDLNGKFIGDDHIVVYISIDIAEFVGYPVEVHLGYARATMAVNAVAQYGTFCAPYAVEVPDGVQAFTVPSVADNNVLDLTEVVGTIPANTPVVLFAEAGLETVESFGVAEAGTPTVGMLTGVYEDTPAPVDSYVLQNNVLVGFYQVAEGGRPTVGANRCYLTTSSGIKAFFFDEDDATAIKAIDNAQQTAKGAIYNLAGQRMSKMQKGINIINGKKVLK